MGNPIRWHGPPGRDLGYREAPLPRSPGRYSLGGYPPLRYPRPPARPSANPEMLERCQRGARVVGEGTGGVGGPVPQRAAHIISSLSHSLSLQFLVGRSLSFSFSSLEHSLFDYFSLYTFSSLSPSLLLLYFSLTRYVVRACGAP